MKSFPLPSAKDNPAYQMIYVASPTLPDDGMEEERRRRIKERFKQQKMEKMFQTQENSPENSLENSFQADPSFAPLENVVQTSQTVQDQLNQLFGQVDVEMQANDYLDPHQGSLYVVTRAESGSLKPKPREGSTTPDKHLKEAREALELTLGVNLDPIDTKTSSQPGMIVQKM